jgi:hypothetical protein
MAAGLAVPVRKTDGNEPPVAVPAVLLSRPFVLQSLGSESMAPRRVRVTVPRLLLMMLRNAKALALVMRLLRRAAVVLVLVLALVPLAPAFAASVPRGALLLVVRVVHVRRVDDLLVPQVAGVAPASAPPQDGAGI